MKKKRFFLIILVITLVFGMITVSCGGGGNNHGIKNLKSGVPNNTALNRVGINASTINNLNEAAGRSTFDITVAQYAGYVHTTVTEKAHGTTVTMEMFTFYWENRSEKAFNEAVTALEADPEVFFWTKNIISWQDLVAQVPELQDLGYGELDVEFGTYGVDLFDDDEDLDVDDLLDMKTCSVFYAKKAVTVGETFIPAGFLAVSFEKTTYKF